MQMKYALPCFLFRGMCALRHVLKTCLLGTYHTLSLLSALMSLLSFEYLIFSVLSSVNKYVL